MTTPEKTIKKETLFIAITISVLIGFLAGTVFTTYRLSSPPSAGRAPSVTADASATSVNTEQARAIATLEAEVTKNQGNGEAWTQLGNLYYDTNQFRKAIDAYTRALAILPASADILTDLGVMYRLNKQPDEAVKAFDRAIQANPRHEPARLNKGVVLLYDLGRLPEALQTWQELLAVNPGAVTANGRPVSNLVAEISKEIASPGDQQKTKDQ